MDFLNQQETMFGCKGHEFVNKIIPRYFLVIQELQHFSHNVHVSGTGANTCFNVNNSKIVPC